MTPRLAYGNTVGVSLPESQCQSLMRQREPRQYQELTTHQTITISLLNEENGPTPSTYIQPTSSLAHIRTIVNQTWADNTTC
jgi:hypothetical protein